MNLSLGLTTSSSVERIKWITERADDLGFYGIWIGKDIGSPQEVFTVTSLLLLGTRRVKVGIGVTSPLIRNITTIARAAATLSQMGRGRFRLGLGIGGLQSLFELGLDAARPNALMRDVATLLRRIWRGETVTFTGNRFRLSNYYARYKPGFATPIYFCVRGPKLLALAGEIGDGVVLSGPKRYIEKAVAIVDQGLRKRRRRRASFRFVVWVPTVIVAKKSDVNLAREAVASVLADTPKALLEMAGIAQERVKPIKAVMVEKGVKGASCLVAEDLLREVAIYGSHEEVSLDLRSLEKYGIDEAIFGPPYGRNPLKAIGGMARAWKRLI